MVRVLPPERGPRGDVAPLNAWCESRAHHPNKSANAIRGRPSWSLSQMQKLCSATLAANRARNPSSSGV
jgi:hypothetical protein